jgi:hypothetical protein
MKKKKTKRVYFIVRSDNRKPTETVYDVDGYPSSVSCYTNIKDAKKDLTSLKDSAGSSSSISHCIVSFDLAF